MSFVIEQQIIPDLPNIKLAAKKYVIAHDSGNPKNVGPDALEREITFMTRNAKNAFVSHWVGGGGRIVQLAPVGFMQYGCGGIGNPCAYAQVELARTDNKAQFEKDYKAYVWLLRKLAKDAWITVELDGKGNGIKTHRWITDNLGGTDHTDPYAYLSSFGISESQFKDDIKNGIGEGDEEEMVFSSPTLRDIYDIRSVSPATAKLLVEKAIKKLNYKEDEWLAKLEKGEITEGDKATMAYELAVYYAKLDK